MHKNLHCVAVKNTEFGLMAFYMRVSSNYNLVGIIADYVTFNVCDTKKEAERVAKFWNECYLKNGKQWKERRA